MTVKDRLLFFSENGMSVSYIARQLNLNPTTLTKWLRNEKGLTRTNEQLLDFTLQELAKKFYNLWGDSNGKND